MLNTGQLKERVCAWNRDRGLTKLNTDLEMRMLSEELHEFWMAEDPAHMLQELCDFRFVSWGTKFKIRACKYESATQYLIWMQDLEAIEEYMLDKYHDMLNRLHEVFICTLFPEMHAYDTTFLNTIINKAMDIVITANEKKGSRTDSSGKVVKGERHVDPYDSIKEMLTQIKKE